jgi:hypothetical protein
LVGSLTDELRVEIEPGIREARFEANGDPAGPQVPISSVYAGQIIR